MSICETPARKGPNAKRAKILTKGYNSINEYLRVRFGERVQKVTLKSGLDCPQIGPGRTPCAYCSPLSYYPFTAKDEVASLPSIKEQLTEGIEYVTKRNGARKFIAYFQSGTNTNGPCDYLQKIFSEAIDDERIVGLAVSTRPDCSDSARARILGELAQKKFTWAELGLQSANDKTLEIISRGHSAADFSRAHSQLSENGVKVCAHVILGLPGEGPSDMIKTAEFLNEAKIWGVKIHNLHVLKGTKLEEMHARGDIHIPTLREYASWVIAFLEHLSPKIVIHRVNGHAPRRLTVAPEWSVNKLAVFTEVDRLMAEKGTFQGKGLIK